MTCALAALVSWTCRWLVRTRRPVLALAVAAVLTGCDGGSGSGQSGSAFTFLTVDSISTDGSVGTVKSDIDSVTSTLACAMLQNNLKNPGITQANALDNVIIQSYTVTLTAASGGALPGPFTFSTSVLVPAGGRRAPWAATRSLPVVLVPAGAKLDPRLRPPTRLPLVATAEIRFRGRNGRGSSVETEGAATVVFVVENEDVVTCTGTRPDPTPTRRRRRRRRHPNRKQ